MRHPNAKYGVWFCGYITTLLTSRVNSSSMLNSFERYLFLQNGENERMNKYDGHSFRFFFKKFSKDHLYILPPFTNIRYFRYLK
jgi:hypothetical protein